MLLAAAMALSLLIVVVYAVARRHHPLAGDAVEYDLQGRFFTQGHFWWSTTPFGVAHASAWKAPLYPLWVGFWYELLGTSPVRVELVQAFLAPLTVVLAWMLVPAAVQPSGRDRVRLRRRRLPARLGVLRPLYPEALAIPMTLVVLLLFLGREPTPKRAAPVGVAVGISLLIRPTSVFLLAGVPRGVDDRHGLEAGHRADGARHRRRGSSSSRRGRFATQSSPTAASSRSRCRTGRSTGRSTPNRQATPTSRGPGARSCAIRRRCSAGLLSTTRRCARSWRRSGSTTSRRIRRRCLRRSTGTASRAFGTSGGRATRWRPFPTRGGRGWRPASGWACTTCSSRWPSPVSISNGEDATWSSPSSPSHSRPRSPSSSSRARATGPPRAAGIVILIMALNQLPPSEHRERLRAALGS